jgi:hypothetical protein
MIQCAGTKRDGSACTATVEPPSTYCWWHDPKNAEERRRAASRGGSSRPSREVRTLKADLRELIGRVESGELEPTPANTMIRAYSVLLEYIRLERGVYVEEELSARLDALKRDERQDAS